MKLKTAQGFTLIELLIVIAVLGILAIAVLSAINPIEQINRSRDTGSRSDSEQLIGAIDRFYATNGYYPWVNAEDYTPVSQAWAQVNGTWVDNAAAGVLAKLSESGTGELKASFTQRISGGSYNTMRVYNEGNPGDSTYVCFSPRSSAFMTEAESRCTAPGGLPGDYPASACNNTTDCGTRGFCSCLP